MNTVEKHEVKRRSIIRGAAWTVPSVVAVTAAPAIAASEECAVVTNDYQYMGSVVVVEVPAEAAYVDYVVRGAGGGNSGLSFGQGALTSGRITFSAPSTPRRLVVAVGQGGEVRGDGATAGGGWGFGSGGSSTPGPRTTTGAFGGGGGGSAILLPGTPRTPLVVAGGGGGAAVAQSVQGSTERVTTHTAPQYGLDFGNSDAGGSGNGRGAGMSSEGSTGTGMAVSPSSAGDGSVGGTGGGGSMYWANNNWTSRTREQGQSGGNAGSGALGGGNGGNGGDAMSNRNTFVAVAGGGGGGYAGGGGGGLAGAQFQQDTRLTISTGTGAAGSSYTSSDRDGLTIDSQGVSSPGLSSGDSRGHEGLVRLSWCI